MNDREVADYLLANPEFFAQHAELLATIRLANPHGKAAISLQERQMEMLRDKNKHLERRSPNSCATATRTTACPRNSAAGPRA